MQRHALGTAAITNYQCRRRLAVVGSAFQGAQAAHFGNRLVQPLQAHGLGEVIHRFYLKSTGGIHGVRSDKHQGWRLRHSAQCLCQHHAVRARHLDVEQQQIHGEFSAPQKFLGLRDIGGLFHHKGGSGVFTLTEQNAQTIAG